MQKSKLEFPKILKAAKEHFAATWALADAILEAAPASQNGCNNGSTEKLKAIAEYLYQNNVFFSVETLRHYRLIAARFPLGERTRGISFSACQEAADPETLDKIIAAGISLNSKSIRKFKRENLSSVLNGSLQRNPSSSTEKISNLAILLSRAFELGNRAEKISRGKSSASLAKQAISISDSFARVAAMLSPLRKALSERRSAPDHSKGQQ